MTITPCCFEYQKKCPFVPNQYKCLKHTTHNQKPVAHQQKHTNVLNLEFNTLQQNFTELLVRNHCDAVAYDFSDCFSVSLDNYNADTETMAICRIPIVDGVAYTDPLYTFCHIRKCIDR